MSDHKSELKRGHSGGVDGGNGNDQKRPKSEINEEKLVDAPAVKTITTICYDVLERIFDFLDLESLLNVADTCKRLRIAAIAKFGEMIQTKDMPDSCSIQSDTIVRRAEINTSNGYIQVTGLKFCLQFLRCFGAKVSKLDGIIHDDNVKHNEYINRYINQYCCDTLTSISMDFKKTTLANLSEQKPFKNVTYLNMTDFIAEKNQLAHFVSGFPNLRIFEIFYFNMDVGIDVTGGVAFPQIEHLTLCFLRADFEWEQLTGILASNQHLKSLLLMDIKIQLTEWLDMIDGYQSITEFRVINEYDLDDGEELSRLTNKNPTICSLDLECYVFKADDIIEFVRQSAPNALKKFSFRVNGPSERDRVLNHLENNEWQRNVSDEDAGGFFSIKLSRGDVIPILEI